MISIVKETITPEKARQYLETNVGNRRLNNGFAESLANEIREGRWQLTHQGIAFDENGRLIDGQHRLTAVALANEPVEMMVARGVAPSENNLYIIDNNRKRSVVDMLKIGQYGPVYTNTRVIGAIQTFFIVKGSRDRNDRLSADEIAKYISANEYGARVLNGFVYMVKNTGKPCNAKVLTALYSAFLYGESEEAIKSFLRCYGRNEIDARYYSKAALDLADCLQKYKLSEAETVARAENAIYCYIHNVKRSRMAVERYKAKDTWFFPVRAKRSSKEDAKC